MEEKAFRVHFEKDGKSFYAIEHEGCSIQESTEQNRRVFTFIEKPVSEAMLVAARDWSYKKYGKPIGNEAALELYQVMREARTAEPHG